MYYTSGYNLPQYEGKDITSWIGVFNEAMRKIDAAITSTLVTSNKNNQVGYNKLLEINAKVKELQADVMELVEDLEYNTENLQDNINSNTEKIKTLIDDVAENYEQFVDFKNNIATKPIDADGQGHTIREAFLKAYQDIGFGDRELNQKIKTLTTTCNETFDRLNKNHNMISDYSPGGSNARTVHYTLKVMNRLILYHVNGELTKNANTIMTNPDAGTLITMISGNPMGMTANETLDFGWTGLVKGLNGANYFIPAHVKCVYQDSKTKFYITGGANFEQGLYMDFTLFSVTDNVVWG